MERKVIRSLQLSVLQLGLLQDGDARVGVLGSNSIAFSGSPAYTQEARRSPGFVGSTGNETM